MQGPVLTTLAVAAVEVAAPETRAQHQRGRREQGRGQALVLMVPPPLPVLPQRGSRLVLLSVPVLHRFQS